MPTRKPPTKPTPRPDARATRTYSDGPNPERPRLNHLMSLLRGILDASDGKLTIRSLASDIGHNANSVAEWIGCRRSAPIGEATISLIRWGATRDRGFIKALLND